MQNLINKIHHIEAVELQLELDNLKLRKLLKLLMVMKIKQGH